MVRALRPARSIATRIHTLRGRRVMLDADLAILYGVTTKRLNEQVRRNAARFPDDFMFQLTADEVLVLRSQSATSNSGRGGRRFRPFAFTEHGAVMLASVLSTPVAVAASVQVVRAFVQLRQALASHADVALRLDELERRYDGQWHLRTTTSGRPAGCRPGSKGSPTCATPGAHRRGFQDRAGRADRAAGAGAAAQRRLAMTGAADRLRSQTVTLEACV
jgi:hypothetical protein